MRKNMSNCDIYFTMFSETTHAILRIYYVVQVAVNVKNIACYIVWPGCQSTDKFFANISENVDFAVLTYSLKSITKIWWYCNDKKFKGIPFPKELQINLS